MLALFCCSGREKEDNSDNHEKGPIDFTSKVNEAHAAPAGEADSTLGVKPNPEEAQKAEGVPTPKETLDLNYYQEARDNANAIFKLLDEDGSGTIEKNEFKERLRESEELAKVFFLYSGYKKPKSGNWSELSIGRNTKKIFSTIDTTSQTREKRVLQLKEIEMWCLKTGAKL